eukprot:9500567-Pyramimonas_sp.AAC.5
MLAELLHDLDPQKESFRRRSHRKIEMLEIGRRLSDMELAYDVDPQNESFRLRHPRRNEMSEIGRRISIMVWRSVSPETSSQ